MVWLTTNSHYTTILSPSNTSDVMPQLSKMIALYHCFLDMENEMDIYLGKGLSHISKFIEFFQ